MRLATARAYLDGMPLATFTALVAPHLEARRLGNEVRYTRASIDAWIDRDGGASDLATPEGLARALQQDHHDDHPHRGRQRLRQ
jgi:hypothetical protein